MADDMAMRVKDLEDRVRYLEEKIARYDAEFGERKAGSAAASLAMPPASIAVPQSPLRAPGSSRSAAPHAAPPSAFPPKVNTNWVGSLGEYCSRALLMVSYEEGAKHGPDHQPIFEMSCIVKDYEGNVQAVAQGQGSNKAQAKQAAARKVIEGLQVQAPSAEY